MTLLIAFESQSKVHHLLVDVGPNRITNSRDFYNEVRQGYETAKSLGHDVHVLAKDGTWQVSENGSFSSFSLTREGKKKIYGSTETPDYPPVEAPAQKAENFKKVIKGLKLNPGDSVIIFLTGHGGPPESANDPSSATLMTWEQDIKYSELTDALRDVPTHTKIKISSQLCYSGGVHSLSRRLKNVCTSATTNHLFTTNALAGKNAPFGREFWNFVSKTKGKDSFAAASMEGLKAQNVYNPNEGQLSSFDYVDFILKRGPYSPPAESSFEQDPLTSPRGGQNYISIENQPSNLSKDISPFHQFQIRYPSFSCFDSKKLEQLSRTLNQITEQAGFSHVRSKISAQPRYMRTIFHEALDDLKKNSGAYSNLFKEFQAKVYQVTKQENLLRKNGWPANWKNQPAEIEELKKGIEELKKIQIQLEKYYFNLNLLQRLDSLEEFKKKATPEQNKKFLELLQCEWEPL